MALKVTLQYSGNDGMFYVVWMIVEENVGKDAAVEACRQVLLAQGNLKELDDVFVQVLTDYGNEGCGVEGGEVV